MGLFDWLRGKKPDHAYENRTARWMHDKIVEHAKDGDAYAIAQAAAALKGEAPMAFGLLLTDTLGDERELVIEAATAALRILVPKLSDHAFDQVLPIIRSARLAVDVEGRRTQREVKKERQAEEIVTKLRTSIAAAGTAELFKGFVALRAGYHDAFGVAVPAAVRAELTELARARVVAAIPDLSDDECDELLQMIEAPIFGVDVSARRDKLTADRRRVRETAIADAVAAEPRNPELEAALAADLDDAAAFSVFADFLGDRGHPRGELIELALRAEHDPTLAPEVERVIAEHADTLLGPLTKFQRRVDYEREPAFTWRRGFIDRARLSYTDDSREQGQPRTSLVELMHALFGHPSGRYLRALALGINGNRDGSSTLDDAIATIVASPPAHVRELLLGDFTQDQTELSWYYVGNVAPLWAALPRLAKLVVRGGSFELGSIVAPALEHAEFHTGGLTAANAKAIATATWPKLRHLDVWFGDQNYGGETTIADARPIMMRGDLPALVHLGLKNCEYTDELCALLGDMPIAAQLESLDLSLGTMSRTGALALARQRLPKLAKLDVSDNFLLAEDIAVLRAAFPFVHAGTQRDEQEYGERVVAVGE